MPRTDKEIAAYIEYFRTAPREERAWALERLAKQEGKTPAEIREICENYKGTNLRKGVPAPDELYERIQSQLRAGQSETQIMRDFGTSATTIAKAKQRMKKAEEKKPEPVEEEKPERISEAYPGQINDNESFVEEGVKTYLPGDVAGDCREKEIDWFRMLDKLEIVGAGILGKDSEVIYKSANTVKKCAGVKIRKSGKFYTVIIAEDDDA